MQAKTGKRDLQVDFLFCVQFSLLLALITTTLICFVFSDEEAQQSGMNPFLEQTKYIYMFITFYSGSFTSMSCLFVSVPGAEERCWYSFVSCFSFSPFWEDFCI